LILRFGKNKEVNDH
jgi:hypothetical protein